jgi:hypothetical protein
MCCHHPGSAGCRRCFFTKYKMIEDFMQSSEYALRDADIDDHRFDFRLHLREGQWWSAPALLPRCIRCSHTSACKYHAHPVPPIPACTRFAVCLSPESLVMKRGLSQACALQNDDPEIVISICCEPKRPWKQRRLIPVTPAHWETLDMLSTAGCDASGAQPPARSPLRVFLRHIKSMH